MSKAKTPKGGARSGSGRPKIEGLKTRKITATDAEWRAMQAIRSLVRERTLEVTAFPIENMEVSVAFNGGEWNVADVKLKEVAPFELTRRKVIGPGESALGVTNTGQNKIYVNESEAAFKRRNQGNVVDFRRRSCYPFP